MDGEYAIGLIISGFSSKWPSACSTLLRCNKVKIKGVDGLVNAVLPAPFPTPARITEPPSIAFTNQGTSRTSHKCLRGVVLRLPSGRGTVPATKETKYLEVMQLDREQAPDSFATAGVREPQDVADTPPATESGVTICDQGTKRRLTNESSKGDAPHRPRKIRRGLRDSTAKEDTPQKRRTLHRRQRNEHSIQGAKRADNNADGIGNTTEAGPSARAYGSAGHGGYKNNDTGNEEPARVGPDDTPDTGKTRATKAGEQHDHRGEHNQQPSFADLGPVAREPVPAVPAQLQIMPRHIHGRRNALALVAAIDIVHDYLPALFLAAIIVHLKLIASNKS
ncbi:hypothetical protein CHU98_g11717 [Xylaria longipes]|nr:hypothetical protein CHU98_g11717 [Xylaria longipes]